MADITREVRKYLSNITLLQDQREKLRTSRDALADKIKDDFKNNERAIPVFKQQGSFDMGTIIRPLDGEFDLDYGVYLDGYSDDEDDWPAPATVHNWIINAVKGHTKTPPENKKTCIRVIYKGEYHIDLPSYIESNSKCKLSHLDNGWIQSQPKDITVWFKNKLKEHGETLRDVVKIFKGWADYQKVSRGKMPSSLVLTVLVSENFVYEDRLDDCVRETAKAIWNQIKDGVEVFNPTDPNEKISDRLSETVKQRFQEATKQLTDDLDTAYSEESFFQSSRIWIDEFGDRFPEATDPDDTQKKNIALLAKSYEAKPTIKPWGYEA